MLQVINPVDGSKLHSVVPDGATVANITPLTELLTARLLKNDPATQFSNFDPSLAATSITANSIKTAREEVVAALNGIVDVTGLDFISAPLKAATSQNPSTGDTQDKILDALKTKLTTPQLTQVGIALANGKPSSEVVQLIAAFPAPTPTTAHAGSSQSVLTGSTVTLDGSGSVSSSGGVLTYSWTLIAKPVASNAALSNTTSAKPTFIADVEGTYSFSLVVNDGKTTSPASTVDITASTGNAAPVARVESVPSPVAGSTVTLNGMASSDANNDPLTFRWAIFSKPEGSTAVLSSPTSATTSLNVDLPGMYTVTLTVNDGKVDSGQLGIHFTASTANAKPSANAGSSQSVIAGTKVTLDGSASSDANSDPLTYSWTLTSKPDGSTATLSSNAVVKPSFTADLPGTYIASLVVNDGKVNSETATTTITATKASTPIGGIINSDTRLTADKSPYEVTSTIQIAYGATLSIDPGVTVKSQNFPIKVFGTLKVAGDPSSYVQLDSLSISNNGTSESQSSSIQITYAKLNGGTLMAPTGNASYGNIVLTDSFLNSVNANGSAYMYIWYPVKDSYIERNVFKNSGGISAGVDTRSVAKKIYIRNNVFTGVIGTAITNWASYGGETTVVSGNSFLDTDKIILSLPGGYDSAAMTATGNFWGTTDQSQVQARIYDKADDLSSAGYVTVLPLLNQPDPQTPANP